MGFRFLHTADWQIGKPFGTFGPETSVRLQEARFTAIDRLADAARSGGAAHVLVAGDVFDHQQPSDRVLHRTMERLAAAPDLTWWLLPGNHDPAQDLGLWARLADAGMPDHVVALTTAQPRRIDNELRVDLLPAPWTSKRPGRDLTEMFDHADQPEGAEGPAAIRIGLAHGGVQSFGSDPDERQIIPADRAERSGLTYLALGDWHGLNKAGPRAWYAGTPEPDSFRNNLRGQALLVDCDRSDDPEPVPIGQFQWDQKTIDCDPSWDALADLHTAGLPARGSGEQLVHLILKGRLRLDLEDALKAELIRLEPQFAHMRVDDAELEAAVEETDLDQIISEGVLKEVAATLQTEANAGDDAAGQALRLLTSFASG